MTDTTPRGYTLGYARVSTNHQDLARQLDALTKEGVDAPIYQDKATGANTKRPGFEKLMSDLRPGDTVLVVSLDRLGRSVRDTLDVVDALTKRGVVLRTLKENLSTADDSVMGRAMLLMLAMLAELERAFMLERAQHARAVAKENGKLTGPPKKLDEKLIRRAVYLRDVEGWPMSRVASELDVSRATLYRAMPTRPEVTPQAQ